MTAAESRPHEAASESPTKATASILSAALGYAKADIPVFPCRPEGKEPLTGDGFRSATTDLDRIAYWWRRWPEANVAMPTGMQTFDVLDVDQRLSGNGWAAFHEMRRLGLLAGAVRLVWTPSGGLHCYFSGTSQRSSRLTGMHIDFKATGGYVLLPPSHVVTDAYAGRYRETESRPQGAPLQWSRVQRLMVPRVGRPLTRPLALSKAASSGPVRRLQEARHGERNNVLFWAACRAMEGAADLGEVVEAARSVGLSDREIAATVNSARRTVVRAS